MNRIKLKLLRRQNATWTLCSVAFALFIGACSTSATAPDEVKLYERSVLEIYSAEKDSAFIDVLSKALRQLNCITEAEYTKSFVLSNNYVAGDSALILVIPFKSILGNRSSCAYSNVGKRFILFNTSMVQEFMAANTSGDSTDLLNVMGFVLLHELGHFVLGKEGAFDEIKSSQSTTGEIDFRTTPEFLTSYKKVELAADSIGAACIKKHRSNSKNLDCFSAASGIEILLPGMQFRLFGLRTLTHFGTSTPNLLKDPSITHPNMELRVAFMNYYLSGLASQKQMIDDYLYERETAPVHRQEMDTRIYQGEKNN